MPMHAKHGSTTREAIEKRIAEKKAVAKKAEEEAAKKKAAEKRFTPGEGGPRYLKRAFDSEREES